MKQKVRYKSATITVDVPYPIRIGVCEACKRDVRDGRINVTHTHHWVYAWKVATVRKKPELALRNTSELCFPDHQWADVFVKMCMLKPEYMIRVIDVAPDYVRSAVQELVVELYDYFNGTFNKENTK